MNQIIEFLIAYGALVLFVVAFAEQSGLPFPGAPWLIAAGALAASGNFSLVAAIGSTVLGCVAADVIWFFLGHRTKTHVFRFFPHLRAVKMKLERATLANTVLHGTRMLTMAKFVPFGNVIPMHAGAMEVGRLRFLLVDAFSAVVYAAVYAALGFAFHNQLEHLVALLRKLGAVSLWLIIGLAGIYFVHWFLKRHTKKESRPDPEKGKAERNKPHWKIQMNTALNPVERLARSPDSARKMATAVDFFYENPDSHTVNLLGDFNGWNPNSHPMRRQPDGRWFLQVPLTHGYYRYLFLVDGVPTLDPRATGITQLDDSSTASVIRTDNAMPPKAN